MAEYVGSDESEIDSVTSSQKSFLKNCPFAEPDTVSTQSFSGGITETDSDSTEILPNPISPPVIRTPILSFSSPTSLDSINNEVFRTPPENASLSSAADSEPRVRVWEMKPASKLKSQSSTPDSDSPENVRVLETNRPDLEVVPLSSSPPSVAADDVRVPGDHSDSDSPSPGSIGGTMVWENQPISDSVGQTGVPKSPSPVRVTGNHSDSDSPSSDLIRRTMDCENQPISGSVGQTGVPKSPSPVRVPVNHSDSDSPSPDSIGRNLVFVNQPISYSVGQTGVPNSPSPSGEEDVPFKEIIEALLRNSGENIDKRDEQVSFVEILRKCGLKFP